MTIIRYGGASLVALLADIGMLATLKQLGHDDLPAVAMAYIFGALVSYLCAIQFVFTHRVYSQRRWLEVALYILIGLAGLATTEFVVATFGRLDAPLVVSKSIAIVVSFFTCYLLRKHLLFFAQAGNGGPT